MKMNRRILAGASLAVWVAAGASSHADRGPAEADAKATPPAEEAPATASVAAPFPKPPIPDNLRLIVGLTEEKRHLPRVRAVQRLASALSPQETTALLWFLHRKAAEDPLPPDKLNHIKNDILNLLLRPQNKPGDLGLHLVAMYRDKAHDPMWRDYCIQFLGQLHARAGGAAQRKAMAEALWEAARDASGPTAGTALIALAGGIGAPGVDKGDVAARALAIASDEQAADPARITALQICAKLGSRKALGVARRLARSAEDACLRMSALAALGALGDASDADLLTECAKSPDVRLRRAAQASLDKIRKGKGE